MCNLFDTVTREIRDANNFGIFRNRNPPANWLFILNRDDLDRGNKELSTSFDELTAEDIMPMI